MAKFQAFPARGPRDDTDNSLRQPESAG